MTQPGPWQAMNERVDSVRRFNRCYTQRIGLLQERYLLSPYSLTEVRVLYELAQREQTTATELARDLQLDPGYLSRILSNFLKRGLLERERSDRDGREWRLGLTVPGMATFLPLEAAARQQIQATLRHLSEGQQERLVRALGEVEALLSEQPDAQPAYTLREPRPGDFGWVVSRHGALYAQEYGWDVTFESMVASVLAKFVDHFEPQHERCWIAERHGEPVGCVFLVKASRRVAKLRLFLVEPEARGLGIGSRMVDELIAFARTAGYHTIRLWTQSILLAARHIYAKAGFKLVSEEPHHSFGHDLVAEAWELRL